MDAKTRPLLWIALLGLALSLPVLFKSNAPPSKPAPAGSPAKGGAGATKPASGNAQMPAARIQNQRSASIETDDFVAEVTDLNGGLRKFVLKADRYQKRGAPVDIVTTDRPEFLPLAIQLKGWAADQAEDNWHMQQLSPRAVQLSRDSDGLHVTRRIEAGSGPYQLWVTTRIENRDTRARNVQLQIATHHYVTRESEGSKVPLLPVRSSHTSHAVCRHDTELERKDRKALGNTALDFPAPIVFSGVENVYFLSAVAPDGNGVERCSVEQHDRGRDAKGDPLGSLFSARVVHKAIDLAPGGSKTYRTLAYLGPKSPNELAAAGHSLKSTIESGWFSSLAEGLTWLLRKIHDVVGNWGVAIILLTLFVKAVLFPLTARQMQSMARMKELKPELDRINELYGGDREKKGAAIMELYRKRGVNPMSGCFPVLVQLPIWFSLYASLSSNVELFRAPFVLWWSDLSAPDPLFFLPLGLGVLMFVQQKMSPATGMDPVQQKMMLYMMPAMITSFMLFLPAGLCLYMLTNSALSIGQQRLIEARLRSASASAGSDPTSSSTKLPPSKSPEQSAESSSHNEPHRAGRPSKAERRWRRGKR
jgi:YidC/Oxa1 family membrane protein insertase